MLHGGFYKSDQGYWCNAWFDFDSFCWMLGNLGWTVCCALLLVGWHKQLVLLDSHHYGETDIGRRHLSRTCRKSSPHLHCVRTFFGHRYCIDFSVFPITITVESRLFVDMFLLFACNIAFEQLVVDCQLIETTRASAIDLALFCFLLFENCDFFWEPDLLADYCASRLQSRNLCCSGSIFFVPFCHLFCAVLQTAWWNLCTFLEAGDISWSSSRWLRVALLCLDKPRGWSLSACSGFTRS